MTFDYEKWPIMKLKDFKLLKMKFTATSSFRKKFKQANFIEALVHSLVRSIKNSNDRNLHCDILVDIENSINLPCKLYIH